ncbi:MULTISPECIES: hypothetical protein [Paenibacillus]|uniref:hypothetical protein n=1 Tax=Paenibacillus TaxID=44249 RepID=UPI000FD88588|nr:MULTISPECIES: hypothetical protein [Paenibacillus]MPY19029.1 hypothetical protein [Paenibacillus glucanolyticus]
MAHQSWIARALRTGTARELLLVPEKEWLLVVETDERMGRPPNGWCLHQVLDVSVAEIRITAVEGAAAVVIASPVYKDSGVGPQHHYYASNPGSCRCSDILTDSRSVICLF